MKSMVMTGSGSMDAERAFHRAARGRRWAALLRRIRGGPAADLPVFDDGHASNGLMQPSSGIREIPLDAIKGTLEPGKAALFDGLFRPAAAARPRWQRLWLAEHRGRVLPPISVARV